MGDSGHPPPPPDEETRYPLKSRPGGSQLRKISPLPGFDLRTVQTIESRYTDWAIPAHRSQDSTDSESAGLSLLGFQ